MPEASASGEVMACSQPRSRGFAALTTSPATPRALSRTLAANSRGSVIGFQCDLVS
jgi:hypothetical protein